MTNPAKSFATVSNFQPIASDNSGVEPDLEELSEFGGKFPIGNSTVRFVANDLTGNEATCTTHVVVLGITSLIQLFVAKCFSRQGSSDAVLSSRSDHCAD